MPTSDHHVLHTGYRIEQHDELGRLLHLRQLLEQGHRHVVVRELKRNAPDSVLPEQIGRAHV